MFVLVIVRMNSIRSLSAKLKEARRIITEAVEFLVINQ